MISWIQQTFQHHFRVVFAVLLAVVIISFVFVIGASPGISHGERKALSKDFFGLNLASQADQTRLIGDAQLSVQLKFGFQPQSGEQIQQFAFVRQACLFLADQLHVPAPSDAEFRESLKKMRMFAGESGQFDVKRYDDFRKNLQSFSGLTETDVARVVMDDLRIERVQKLVAGPGYALPADILRNLELVDTSWTLVTAKLDRASFQPTINPSDAELAKFFEENAFRYQHPTRLIASYALFPTGNYVNAVKVNDADLRAYFDANPARFAPAEAKPAVGEAPAVDFNAVKNQVLQAFVAERAARLASEDAYKLAEALFDAKAAIDSPVFNELLSKAKVVAKDLPAFSIDALPAELGNDQRLAEEAGRLSADRTVSDAIDTPRGSVVLFYKNSIPPTQPQLVEVKARVLEDYRENERVKRFIAAGAAISGAAQAKILGGQSFEVAVKAIAEGQGIKVETKQLAPFTFRQPPQEVDRSIYNTLLTLKKGEVSPMVSTADAGYLVFALDRKVPELSEANPNYALIRTNYTTAAAQANVGEYLQDMISAELARSAAR